MARLPGLIDALAALDTRGRPTIEHVARLVREAGYIQTTKRGRGAADMTEADAAALLIGLNAIENPVDAAKQVAVFVDLPIHQSTSNESLPLTFDLKAVGSSKNFGAALESLILAVPTLERLQEASKRHLARTIGPELTGVGIPSEAGFSLEVSFILPGPVAAISVRWIEPIASSNEDSVLSNGFLCRFAPKDPKRRKNLEAHGDRKVTVEIGLRTLSTVHRVLWPPD